MNVSNSSTVNIQTIQIDSLRAPEVKTEVSLKPNTDVKTKTENPKPMSQDLEKKVSDWISNNTNLQFSVDDKSGTRVVKILDSNTKEVIRQIPSEDMIRIAEAIDKFQESGNNAIKGLLLKQQA